MQALDCYQLKLRAPLSKRTKGKVIQHFWEKESKKQMEREIQSFASSSGPLARFSAKKEPMPAKLQGCRRPRGIALTEKGDGGVNYNVGT